MNLIVNIARAARVLRLRAIRAVVALVCVLGACFALAAVPAAAKVINEPEGFFGAGETPAESFAFVLAIGVDNSTGPSAGDVYVGGDTESGSGYVYKFSKDGKYTGIQLNGSETTQGSFSFLDFSNLEGSRGLAVDDSTGANMGDVYLADAEHDVIDRFSEDGEFKCEITGKEYSALSTIEREHECAGSAGSKTPQDGFHVAEYSLTALGVAVDPLNGDVYVSSPADKAIDEFTEGGEYVGQIVGAHITSPGSLAFNSSGELYVANAGLSGGEDVVKLDASGTYLSTLDESEPLSVAVSPADGGVYVAEGGDEEQTAEYNSAGHLISTFGKQQSGAVAVSGATGRIYVSQLSSSFVYMYSKTMVAPNLNTGGASEVKGESATLHGEVEPEPTRGGSNIESCEFEYVSEYALHHVQKVSVQPNRASGGFTLGFDGKSTSWAGEGKLTPESTTVTEVTQAEGLTGLPLVGEEIHGDGIRSGTTIVAYSPATHEITLSQDTEEAVSENHTLDAALPASAQPELIKKALEALTGPRDGVPAQMIGSGEVVVSGPAGGPWTVEFTGSLGSVVVPLLEVLRTTFVTEAGIEVEGDWPAASKAACAPAVPYSEAKPVSAQVSGLAPGATYQYRLTAADSEGATTGETKTFSTYGPPSLDREAAESLQTTAELKAHINPRGYDTTCQAQYVSDADFQQSQWANATTLPCQQEDLGSGFGEVTAKVKVHGLGRATIYHYRFLATNQAGVTAAPGGAFETYGIRQVSMEFLKNSTISGGLNEFWQAGEPETLQAGAHPYELVTTVTLSHTTEFTGESEEVVGNTAVNTKDIKVELPPGIIGNPTSLPKCSRYLAQLKECPSDTQVGMIEVWVDYPLGRGSDVSPLPEEFETEELIGRRYIQGLYNVEPAGPRPAEFAAFIEGNAPAWVPFEVRNGSDYGITANSIDLTDVGGGISRVRTRVWGVPADPRHEAERNNECPESVHLKNEGCPDTEPAVPLLTNPTSCAGPLRLTASSDSWQELGQYASKTIEMPGFTGCGKLKFEPSLEAQPTTSVADSPSGLNVDLHVPQPEGCKEEAGEAVCELAEADLRNATVTLPAGMVVNPSAADGLQACSEAQIGYLEQRSMEVGHPQFTPEPAECPDASKVGSVEVITQVIDHPLLGAVYVAAQDANPFKSLLALYFTVYDPQTGVVIKLPAKVALDPVTGRLTTTIDEDPQLPFTDFKEDFFSGSRAALTTPFTCGSYATSSDLMPWSAPEGKDAEPSSLPFAVSGAPGGAACASSEAQAPNAPGFEAGAASPVAGSYSPFVLKLKREDASQRFGSLNVTLPPGLIGKIAGLEECPQAAIEVAQARSHEGEGVSELAHPSCPAGSEVGVVHGGVGSGAPYYVTGHVYFAGPYKSAPFSLLIVTPALAGPFDFGSVVVRAALYFNPNTAQVTVKSDPFPTILDGVPLDIRDVNVDMNRSQFTLNPTSCATMAVTGEESSTAGSTAVLSDRFQAGGCATLPFKPGFSVSTSAKATRADGTSVTFKISYPASALGKEAWLSAAKFEFPKQLPARLSTIQKSCPAVTFDANPALCGVGSRIGSAVVRTQLLPVALEGPVYFVSNGSAKFPEAVIVLQGDGVTVDLHSETFINEKTGVTSATLPAIPGVPFEEATVTLPSGQYSEFTTNTSLCTSKTVTVNKKVTVKSKGRKKTVTRKVEQSVTSALALKMPTVFTGQNGAQVTQKTPIGVTGCPKTVKPKPKTVKKPKKPKKIKKHGKRR